MKYLSLFAGALALTLLATEPVKACNHVCAVQQVAVQQVSYAQPAVQVIPQVQTYAMPSVAVVPQVSYAHVQTLAVMPAYNNFAVANVGYGGGFAQRASFGGYGGGFGGRAGFRAGGGGGGFLSGTIDSITNLANSPIGAAALGFAAGRIR